MYWEVKNIHIKSTLRTKTFVSSFQLANPQGKNRQNEFETSNQFHGK